MSHRQVIQIPDVEIATAPIDGVRFAIDIVAAKNVSASLEFLAELSVSEDLLSHVRTAVSGLRAG